MIGLMLRNRGKYEHKNDLLFNIKFNFSYEYMSIDFYYFLKRLLLLMGNELLDIVLDGFYYEEEIIFVLLLDGFFDKWF